MKRLFVAAAALVLMSALSSNSQASHGPGCGVSVSYVDQVVTCYRTEIRQVQETINVTRCTYRTEVTPVKRTVLVPTTVQQKQTVMVPVTVQRKQMVCVPVTVQRKTTVMAPVRVELE
jgi:hypothetical protein